ncbi:MAG: glutamine synthetase [Hyphomicrobiales bacterium]|nr:glutamine synthetase family protein [Hyphomicrobiales bacterium]MDE2283247.1 glutamine synthetase [Hyphomicrobiales bacterium]
MTKRDRATFIERHGLWSDEERRLAADVARRVEAKKLRFVRLAWGDAHGYSRAKTLTIPAFISALSGGYNIGVATTTLDSAGARVFASFTRGGGMGLSEMTGSPNLTIVADPATFRVLPWADGVGWILGDEYFDDGRPFHFSPRQLLRKTVQRLAEHGYKSIVGPEIEWYLLRVVEAQLSEHNIGAPGLRGRPIKTAPVEPGYHYHSESNMDLMHAVFDGLGQAFEALGMGLRSIENEWGPGQVECTFAPREALEAADNVLLFRTATRQICRRLGYFATFMCRPALKGFYSNGWHLHQSLVDAATGDNLFTPQETGRVLSPLGQSYLAGLLQYAVPATVFATPTVNGYRRLRPNSLAPDRATWAYDHRGAMIRVLGGVDDPATRLENRVGEPAANPYLYNMSQIMTGLAGIESGAVLPPPSEEPYAAERPLLPKSLPEALDALDSEPLFRRLLGDTFIDYFVKLKRTEAGRYQESLQGPSSGDEASEWEQNEYFDFF